MFQPVVLASHCKIRNFIYQRPMQKHILILGGSSEGFTIASMLHDHPAYKVMSSLAGRTSVPKKPKGPYRIGGFGGSEGLEQYIKTHQIDAIIDATHPFAQKISSNANIAAAKANCPILHLWRKEWQKTNDDHWIDVPTMQAAAQHLNQTHSPVFLTIGRLELAAFLSCTEITLYSRAIEPATKAEQKTKLSASDKEQAWPDNFHFIYAKGPFTYEKELALIKQHNIKAIVTKNSGGPGAYAKLEVARTLKLPVIMISRPEKPKGQIATNPQDALKWLENLS